MFIFDWVDNVEGFSQQYVNSRLKRTCRHINSTANHAATATPALPQEFLFTVALGGFTLHGAARRGATRQNILPRF